MTGKLGNLGLYSFTARTLDEYLAVPYGTYLLRHIHNNYVFMDFLSILKTWVLVAMSKIICLKCEMNIYQFEKITTNLISRNS